MSDLPSAGPDFSKPIEALKACHVRIRQECERMCRLVEHMKTFPDEESMAVVRAHDVNIIIAHGAFFNEGMYEKLIDRIDQRDDLPCFRDQLEAA